MRNTTVYFDVCMFDSIHSVQLASADPGAYQCGCSAVKYSPSDVSRIKARYCSDLYTDWPHYYVRLALVKGEKVTRADKNLEKITRLTLQGQVDEILSKKEPLYKLKDIFHYQNKPCPRLILVMGGPGECGQSNSSSDVI